MNLTWNRLKKSIGPGVITGVADDDPSGIATYGQTGAIFGLGQLWLALYTLPFMIAVQEMCARIGMTTGKGLAGIIKAHYSKPVLFFAVLLLGIANIINIGADLGAMGQAAHMIIPVSSGVALLCITIFSLVTAILIPYPLYARILKYLALTVFAYVITAFFINYDWLLIFKSLLVPHILWNEQFLFNMMAFLGTTISPYLFFWQADEEVEEEIEKKKIVAFGKGRPKVSKQDIEQMKTDTVIGMTLSNLVAFFIMITAAGTLNATNTGEIATAAQLAEALRPFAGDFAVYLFAYGIIGTGLLAVPILAGSFAYAIGETFDMKLGLGKTFMQATGFYSVLIIAMLLGVILNFINMDPVHMLYYSAAANGLLAAPILFIILFIANNRRVMGDKVNGKWSNALVGSIAFIMAIISIFTIEALIR
ncbi:MAG: divalent metal cation transporter [Candidatus Pacebacteria bacterium]|nr:divalent metal cation transporter [Candidatus Paceibacterota bacterium]